MKIYLLLVSLFLGYITSYSQENWTAIEENEHYCVSSKEITYKNESDGINHQRIVFRYENRTSNPILLTFNREVTYDGQLKLQEQEFSVSLYPASTVEYDESKKYDKTYYLFKEDNKKTINKSLDNFKITHLRIN